jgi:hypothetical protein
VLTIVYLVSHTPGDEGGNPAFTVPMGIVVGGGLGGVLGHALGRTERKDIWEPVSMRHRTVRLLVAPTAHRGVRAGLSIGF